MPTATNLPMAMLSSMLAALLIALHPVSALAASPSESDTAAPTEQQGEKSEPEQAPADSEGEAASPATRPRTPQDPATVEAALEAGDLTTARKLAVQARKQNRDDPQRWKTEAQVHEARGDLAAAITAWKGYLRVVPEDATAERELAKQRLEALRARARGTVESEPASSHRDEFARERTTEPEPAPPRPEPTSPAPTGPEDRLVKKWYFWVTLVAIAASAAAVTGIAIKAATTEQSDALGLGRAGPASMGPALFRF